MQGSELGLLALGLEWVQAAAPAVHEAGAASDLDRLHLNTVRAANLIGDEALQRRLLNCAHVVHNCHGLREQWGQRYRVALVRRRCGGRSAEVYAKAAGREQRLCGFL